MTAQMCVKDKMRSIANKGNRFYTGSLGGGTGKARDGQDEAQDGQDERQDGQEGARDGQDEAQDSKTLKKPCGLHARKCVCMHAPRLCAPRFDRAQAGFQKTDFPDEVSPERLARASLGLKNNNASTFNQRPSSNSYDASAKAWRISLKNHHK